MDISCQIFGILWLLICMRLQKSLAQLCSSIDLVQWSLKWTDKWQIIYCLERLITYGSAPVCPPTAPPLMQNGVNLIMKSNFNLSRLFQYYCDVFTICFHQSDHKYKKKFHVIISQYVTTYSLLDRARESVKS